jgi:hypothetical protein
VVFQNLPIYYTNSFFVCQVVFQKILKI